MIQNHDFNYDIKTKNSFESKDTGERMDTEDLIEFLLPSIVSLSTTFCLEHKELPWVGTPIPELRIPVQETRARNPPGLGDHTGHGTGALVCVMQ